MKEKNPENSKLERLKTAITDKENWKTWRESNSIEELDPAEHEESVKGTVPNPAKHEESVQENKHSKEGSGLMNSKESDPAEQGESREGTLSQESNTVERKKGSRNGPKPPEIENLLNNKEKTQSRSISKIYNSFITSSKINTDKRVYIYVQL